MADLEAAADTALAALKELETHIEEAHEAYDELEEAVHSAQDRLESDWTELEQRAESLLGVVEAQRQRAATEAEEAKDALGALEDAAERTRDDGSESIEDGQQAVDGLAEAATASAPRVERLAEQLDQQARSFREQAQTLDGQLTQSLLEARDFLQDQMVSELQEMKDALEERRDAVERVLAEECPQALEAAYQDWEAKLTHVEGMVEKAFDDAQAHVEDVVLFSTTECAEAHVAALGALRAAHEALLTSLDALAQANAAREAVLEGDQARLETALVEVSAAVQAMIAALGRVKEVMARYTFVEL